MHRLRLRVAALTTLRCAVAAMHTSSSTSSPSASSTARSRAARRGSKRTSHSSSSSAGSGSSQHKLRTVTAAADTRSNGQQSQRMSSSSSRARVTQTTTTGGGKGSDVVVAAVARGDDEAYDARERTAVTSSAAPPRRHARRRAAADNDNTSRRGDDRDTAATTTSALARALQQHQDRACTARTSSRDDSDSNTHDNDADAAAAHSVSAARERTADEQRANALLRRVVDTLCRAATHATRRASSWRTRWQAHAASADERALERQLDAALRANTLDAHAAVARTMQQRYRNEAALRRPHSVAFVLLYARTLASYGVFCLVNFATQRAVQLLQEAIRLTQEAYALHTTTTMTTTATTATTTATATTADTTVVVPWEATHTKGCDMGAAAVVHLRVLLANALAAEQQHWRAAQQYEAAVHTIQRHPCYAPLQLSPGGVLAWQPLSEAFVREDARQFWRNAAQVQQALTQGKAHMLLLQSQNAEPRRVAAAQLSLARLYHASSRYNCNSNSNNNDSSKARDDADGVSAAHAAEAQKWYEAYLDGLVARGDEDEHDVMLELGRMLCFAGNDTTTTATTTTTTTAAVDVETGLVYLESAAELAREEAEAALHAWRQQQQQQQQQQAHEADTQGDAQHGQTTATTAMMHDNIDDDDHTAAHTRVPVPVVCSVVRAAGALIDTAMALRLQPQQQRQQQRTQKQQQQLHSRALVLLDSAVTLLTRASLTSMACWAVVQHAELLAQFGFVDRALEGCLRAMRVLRAAQTRGAVPLQLTTRQCLRPFTAAAAEAHLAYCLHVYVGDYRRAAHHYQRVCGGAGLHRAARRVRARRARGSADEHGHAASVSRGATADDVACNDVDNNVDVDNNDDGDDDRYALEPDMLHWALTHYVACCERLQRWQAAVVAQTRLVEVTAALGLDAVSTYLRLAELFRKQGNLERQLALYFFLFFLPDDALTPATRLRVAHGFAKCCYLLDNHRMGAVLLRAVQYVRRDHDAMALVDYALCLRSLRAVVGDDDDGGSTDANANSKSDNNDNKSNDDDKSEQTAHTTGACTSVSHIAAVFRRAARIIVAHRVIDDADARAATASTSSSSSSSTAARVSSELSSLIALSRGAFFFHQHGMTREAKELYACALDFADAAGIDEAASATYAHELAILLTNYATLKAATSSSSSSNSSNTSATTTTTSRDAAEALYARAAALSPRHLDVAEVIVDYYTQTGNYAAGAAYIRRVCAAHPDAAPRLQLSLARLATGSQAWHSLTAHERLEALECLVRSLGVAAQRLPTYTTPTTPANIAARTDALDALLLDGVSTTTSGDVACLVNYVVQTRLRKPALLNRLYRAALRKFPYNTALLVNYATFCADHHYTDLARVYYAKAYGIADGDFSRTQCYANFLSSVFHSETPPQHELATSTDKHSNNNNNNSNSDSSSAAAAGTSSSSSLAYYHYGSPQTGCGEVLYRDFVERHPRSALAHTHYANYLAVALPTPFVTEAHFQRAVRLDERSSNTYQLYAHFVWACADSRAAYADAAVQASVFDKAEQLMQRAVACEPHSVSGLLHLGTFYANRRDRFHDAMTTLYRAHRLCPHNVEVVRQMCAVLVVECARTHEVEQRRMRAAAKQQQPQPQQQQQRAQDGSVTYSRRLRALVDAAHRAFERAVQLDPHHRATLERYAGFAVTLLRDHVLAAELYRRLQHLDQHD